MDLIGHGLAFEPAFLQGGVLVYGAEFGSPAARHREFWTSLCDPEGRLLAHLRFERRLGLSGRALFALAEVRLPPAEEEGERGTPAPFLTPAEFARACKGSASARIDTTTVGFATVEEMTLERESSLRRPKTAVDPTQLQIAQRAHFHESQATRRQR